MFEIERAVHKIVEPKLELEHFGSEMDRGEALTRLEAQRIIHQRSESLDRAMIDVFGYYGFAKALNIYKDVKLDMQQDLHYDQRMPFNYGGTWKYTTTADTPNGTFSSTIHTEADPTGRNPHLPWYSYYADNQGRDPRLVTVRAEGTDGTILVYVRRDDHRVEERGNMTIHTSQIIDGERESVDVECTPAVATEFCLQVFGEIEQTLQKAIITLREQKALQKY